MKKLFLILLLSLMWIESSFSKEIKYSVDMSDKIINELKNNAISKDAAKVKILNIQNLELAGIDESNVDEVIAMELENN